MVEQDGVKVMIITSDTEQHRVGVAVLYEKKLHLFHLFAVIDPYDDMMLNSQTTFFFFSCRAEQQQACYFLSIDLGVWATKVSEIKKKIKPWAQLCIVHMHYSAQRSSNIQRKNYNKLFSEWHIYTNNVPTKCHNAAACARALSSLM